MNWRDSEIDGSWLFCRGKKIGFPNVGVWVDIGDIKLENT